MANFNVDVGKRIEKVRKDRGLTLKQLGGLIGISEGTAQRYEKGLINRFDISMLTRFADALRVPPEYLMGWDDSGKYALIPVYGSIPAGVPIEAVENIQGYEDIPIDWLTSGKRYIALKVKGDSMYPKYLDGDTVIILLQPDCESGQDCACYVNSFDATLKTVFKKSGQIELRPINTNYAPTTYKHPGEVVILGIVKELRRKVR